MKSLIFISLFFSFSLLHSQTRIPINSPSSGVDPSVQNLTEFDGKLFFSGYNDAGDHEVFSYDGNNVQQVSSFGYDSNPMEFFVSSNNQLYFTALDGASNRILYYIDAPTPSLPIPVSNSEGANNIIEYNGDIYFQGTSKMHKYDPVTTSAIDIANDVGYPGLVHKNVKDRKRLFVAGDKLFFNKISGGIYFVDLNAPFPNSQEVGNTSMYSIGSYNAFESYHIGNKVLANAFDSANNIRKLLLIDASPSNPTTQEITLNSSSFQIGYWFVQYQGFLLFTAIHDTNGYSIWYIDDTATNSSDFNYISGVQSNPNVGLQNSDPYFFIDNQFYHYNIKLGLVNGVPDVTDQKCFPYTAQVYLNGRFYYDDITGGGFNLTSCDGFGNQVETCFSECDNPACDIVEYQNEIYITRSECSMGFFELWKWPEDPIEGGLCQPNTCTETCLDFDGVDDYVECTDDVLDPIGSGDFTIEFIIKGSSNQQHTHPPVLSNRSIISGLEGFMVFFHNNSSYKFLSIQMNGFNFLLPNNGTFGADVLDDDCHHIAISKYNDSELRYYIDGVYAGSRTITPGFHDLLGVVNFNIGRDIIDNSFFNGGISNVRIWNYARLDADIAAKKDVTLTGNEPGLIAHWAMNEGVGSTVYDSSCNNNHGQFGGVTNTVGEMPIWNGNCIPNPCTYHHLVDIDSISTGVYYAEHAVQSASNVVINEDVEFHAPYVHLDPLFNVELGAEFETFTDDCTSCTITPICLKTIRQIDPVTMNVSVLASDLDGGVTSSCSSPISISYSADVNDTVRVYECNDLGNNFFDLWYTDIYGNTITCSLLIEIQDPNGICP